MFACTTTGLPTQRNCEDARRAGADSAAGEQPWTLGRIFSAYRARILVTYGLFSLENGLRLVQPWVLGTTISLLLGGAARGLTIFLLHQCAYVAVLTARQLYDTRTYRSIYADLAGGIVAQQRRRNVDVSRVAARSALSRDMVDFFERDVPIVLYSLYSLVGATVMLCFYDPALMAMCLLPLPILLMMNRRYGRRTLWLTAEIHDRLEQEVAVVRDGCPSGIRAHFLGVSGGQVKLSDLEAVHYARIRAVGLLLATVSLARTCWGTSANVGHIIAVFGYVMVYVGGLAATPQLVRQINRLRDIGRRLRLPADAG